MNEPRKRKCQACGRALPKRRRPTHARVLNELSYDDFVALNGGSEDCGICGRPKNPARNHDRDHDHKTGKARGLLCPGNYGCNKRLARVDDLAWLELAAAYLRRAA